MRIPPSPLLAFASLVALVLPASAENVLRSSSLAACQANSGFTASLFDVIFTPNNNTVAINMIATSSIEGHVIFDIRISAYGYEFMHTTMDPCKSNLPGLCPMTAGDMSNPFILPVTPSAANSIPGIAYSFPDLDATVRILVNMTDGDQAGQSIACVEANISNGKTVDLIGVKWAAAAVAGLALIASAVVSGLGFSNAASHVAANTLSLFGYFQAQAMIGLCGVPLPPVVASWTQDFQWSMGIIKVDFIQDILTWYQRSTGGTPSTILDSIQNVSVQVEKVKRALPMLKPGLSLFRRAAALLPNPIVTQVTTLAKRANVQTFFGSYIVYGIQRVAFRAAIESTNLFMTGLTFFYIFVVLAALCVSLFKGFCELSAKLGWIKSDTFADFRNGWLTVLKGVLFRVTLIGYPQMVILCLWEFTQIDSPAEVVLAVFFFFGMTGVLAFSAFKVMRLARRSVALHQNPGYILFSDPQALNKWGFLYVQFRASAYYFIIPILGYTLVKGMFIALAQAHGSVQAVAFIIIEVAALIAASVLRPWMDKSTNSFNIAICAMNFVNAIFLFVFTDVLGLPPLVIGVVGVVLWIANAAFSLILLLMLIVTTTLVLFHNNPDTRYQFMNDDRTSFMKSQTHFHTNPELDALGATARASGKWQKPALDLDDDGSSMSGPANMPLPASGSNSARNSLYSNSDAHAIRPQSHGAAVRPRPSSTFRAPSPFTSSREPSPFAGSSSSGGHQSQTQRANHTSAT
ncbi:hypothetical protein B0T26DRAFT_631347 [Lasiosphaeria miniovina]|uniref:ML-like domain-containing protein n=1 Tax=Lasiosphaeria miniovina TaxID=1954250 RepID=A0AA40BF27_9PEZI|nr:uncharacterized protein B0T26DRAFT_631347 [Lasiosphaeria miniovina]KAK0733030.1 hypothetical protein B0T26DRAFT_631347 [Lasiosphaeria miniovina]